MTGMISFVRRTPVFYMSKQQQAIEIMTYGTKFAAMQSSIEEVIFGVRYMLQALRVKVTRESLLAGDNMLVIQNVTIKESFLKKKHVTILYHKTREAAAGGIVLLIKTIE